MHIFRLCEEAGELDVLPYRLRQNKKKLLILKKKGQNQTCNLPAVSSVAKLTPQYLTSGYFLPCRLPENKSNA